MACFPLGSKSEIGKTEVGDRNHMIGIETCVRSIGRCCIGEGGCNCIELQGHTWCLQTTVCIYEPGSPGHLRIWMPRRGVLLASMDPLGILFAKCVIGLANANSIIFPVGLFLNLNIEFLKNAGRPR